MITEGLLVLLCAGACLTFGLRQRALISYLWSEACLWAQPAALQGTNHDMPPPPPPPPPPPLAHVIWVDEPIPENVLKESKELNLQQALAKQTLQHSTTSNKKDMYSWAEWVRSDGNCGPDYCLYRCYRLQPFGCKIERRGLSCFVCGSLRGLPKMS